MSEIKRENPRLNVTSLYYSFNRNKRVGLSHTTTQHILELGHSRTSFYFAIAGNCYAIWPVLHLKELRLFFFSVATVQLHECCLWLACFSFQSFKAFGNHTPLHRFASAITFHPAGCIRSSGSTPWSRNFKTCLSHLTKINTLFICGRLLSSTPKPRPHSKD